MTDLQEQQYLSQIANGNHDAFRIIFMKYYPKMKYFITQFVKSEAIAEELSQDIFLKIWENREKLVFNTSFSAYLYRMARNSSLNHLERKSVEAKYAETFVATLSDDPENELNAKEMELLIQMAIERMPEQRRTIYRLSRVDGLDQKGIAEKLKIAQKTVQNQLSLALKDIREKL